MKITKNMVVSWLGDEATEAPALLAIVIDLVSGERDIEKIREECRSFADDNKEYADGTCEECGDPKIIFINDDECECLECGHKFDSGLR